jgi:hypothetical protein
MRSSPVQVFIALAIASCLACAHGRSRGPVEGLESCTAGTSDRGTLIRSETDGYAMILVGTQWLVDCPREPYLLLYATELDYGFQVQLSSNPAGSKPLGESHRDFTNAMIDGMILAYGLPNPEIEVETAGDDNRTIECFGGPIVFDGVDAQLYGCTSVKPVEDRVLEYSIVLIATREIWLANNELLSSSVAKLATLWWPSHELPEQLR